MPEQWEAALKRGNEVRIAHCRAREALRDGKRSVASVLSDPELRSMQIGRALRALPLVGPYRAKRLLKAEQIDPERPLGSLTDRQRKCIEQAVAERHIRRRKVV